MAKLTQEEAIKKHLAITDAWIPSYDLNKVEVCDTWIGDRGSRTARYLAEVGAIQRELGKDLLRSGIKLDYKGRSIVPKYCYYHTLKPLKKIGIYRTLPDGTRELISTRYETNLSR